MAREGSTELSPHRHSEDWPTFDLTARLTDKQRQMLSSNFFGKLVHTYTCESVTSKYEGTAQTYQLRSMKEWGDTVTIEYYDPDSRRNVKDILTVTGNCYSVPVARLGFEEVFCRVK
ncbi:MAG TPA: hypothetical protein VFH35_04225 [Ramlibacter sp.]|nr:hypothetical protein [Ramlibacter sp.]